MEKQKELLDNRIFAERLTALCNALGKDTPQTTNRKKALAAVVDVCDRSQVWLALATMTGHLPTEVEVIETSRAAEFDPEALYQAVTALTNVESASLGVQIIKARDVAYVGHTAQATFLTGIQRVVWETMQRWVRDHDITLVAMNWPAKALRPLSDAEANRMAHGPDATGPDLSNDPSEYGFVIPWECRFFVPELAGSAELTKHLRAMLRFGRNALNAIGFDLIPFSTSETTATGMSNSYAEYLTVLRYAKNIVPISEAAAVEFSGWAKTLSAIGYPAPAVKAVPLPASAGEVTEQNLAEAARRFKVMNLPLVLVVGSHEPRKNHLAILQAAELLWREGLKFSLTFVGGHSWMADEFYQNLAHLQAVGRPVESVTGLDDALLWAAYRLADFTVFPSLNEGFGLPVVESLAVGTPAITSNYGSMAEIAADGGCLLVDPRDDDAITDAMRQLLTDPDLLERLREQALRIPRRTWDDYAAEVWYAIQ